MLKSYWTRLFLIGLIICCASLCYAQGENISLYNTFATRLDNILGFASSGQYSYVLHWPGGLSVNIYDVTDLMDVNLVSVLPVEYNPTSNYGEFQLLVHSTHFY